MPYFAFADGPGFVHVWFSCTSFPEFAGLYSWCSFVLLAALRGSFDNLHGVLIVALHLGVLVVLFDPRSALSPHEGSYTEPGAHVFERPVHLSSSENCACRWLVHDLLRSAFTTAVRFDPWFSMFISRAL